MKPIPYSVSCKLRESGVVRLRVRWCGHELMISPGVKVEPVKFSGNRAKPGTFHTKDRIPAGRINERLQAYEDAVASAFADFERRGIVPDTAQLKRTLNLNADRHRTAGSPLVELYGRYVEERKTEREWSFNTIKSVRTFGKVLEKFAPGMAPSQINPDTMRDFVRWQHTARLSERNESSGEPGYSNAVIRKNCRMFRWFVDWLVEKGITPPETSRMSKVHVKAVSRPVVYLSRRELDRIEGWPFPIGTDKDRARDFLLFCAYTSLRYSDASRLMKTDVSENSLSIVAEKTGTRLNIELNRHSRSVLDKYRPSPDTRALPRITLNRLNHLIKEIGRECGIDTPVTVSQYYGGARKDRTVPKWELLSSHTGRRSFVVNALSRGIAPSIVMKWTGHSDWKAMLPYIDIADREKADAMALMD